MDFASRNTAGLQAEPEGFALGQKEPGPRLLARTQLISLSLWSLSTGCLSQAFFAVSKSSCPAHSFSCPLWTDPDPRSREGSRWSTATSPVRGRQQVTGPSQNCDRLFPRTSCFPGCWASLPGRTLDKAFGSLSFSSLIKYLQIHLLPNDIGGAPGNFLGKNHSNEKNK